MGSWAQGPLLGFDTETTGVDVTTDRIVTAALVYRNSRGTRVKTWLIDPGVEIPEAAAAIHGVTTEMVRADGQDPATALEEIAGYIAEAQRRGAPVVAFNAAYDLSILDHELARHGLPTLPERLGGCPMVIDPLVIDRGLNRYRRGKRRLGDLCRVYEVTEQENLHTADVDVIATLDVLTAIVDRHPDFAARELEDVHAWQAVAHERWATHFNAWRAEQGLEGPGADLGWPLLTGADVATAS